jgi:hypothetical protein
MIRTDPLYSAVVALRLLDPLPLPTPAPTIHTLNDLIRMPNVPTPTPNVKIPTLETHMPHGVINPNHHLNNPSVPPPHQEATLRNPLIRIAMPSSETGLLPKPMHMAGPAVPTAVVQSTNQTDLTNTNNKHKTMTRGMSKR